MLMPCGLWHDLLQTRSFRHELIDFSTEMLWFCSFCAALASSNIANNICAEQADANLNYLKHAVSTSISFREAKSATQEGKNTRDHSGAHHRERHTAFAINFISDNLARSSLPPSFPGTIYQWHITVERRTIRLSSKILL